MQNIFSEKVKVVDGQAELSKIPEIILNFGKVLVTKSNYDIDLYRNDIYAKATRAYDNVVNIINVNNDGMDSVDFLEVQIEYATKFPIVVMD